MQSLSSSFKPFWLVLLAVAFLFLASLALPLAVGIWLPDIVFAPKRTLAEKRLEDGRIFCVSQSWAVFDFNYQTELEHISPNGATISTVLDYDDSKSWQVPMQVDEKEKLVRVTLGRDRPRVVSWDGVRKN